MEIKTDNKKRFFERAGGVISRSLVPIGAVSAITGVVADFAGVPGGAPIIFMMYGLFAIPCVAWKVFSTHGDIVDGPLENVGRELDHWIHFKKRPSFGGLPSIAALIIAGITAFVGTFYLFGTAKDLLLSVGVATPVGAAIAGIATAVSGIIGLCSAYGSLKKWFEWLAGKHHRSEHEKKLNFWGRLKLYFQEKARELARFFSFKNLKQHWPELIGAGAAIAFSVGLALLLAPTLPLTAPGVIAFSTIFGFGTFIGVRKPMQNFCRSTYRMLKRFILGTIMRKDTANMHSKDKKERADSALWNALPLYKRVLFGYSPALFIVAGLSVPGFLAASFPPVGIAFAALGMAAALYMLVYPSIRAFVISRLRKKAPIEDPADNGAEEDSPESKTTPLLAIEWHKNYTPGYQADASAPVSPQEERALDSVAEIDPKVKQKAA